MPAGNACHSGHLVPSPFVGLACAPIVETRFLELALSLLDFSPWIPSCTFSILLRICDIYLKTASIFLFWFKHRRNATRLYVYTSSYLFHIKSLDIICQMLSSTKMLVFITAEICLPYSLLSKIDIPSLLKSWTHLKRVFLDTKYSFTLQEISSNAVSRAKTR